MTKRTMWIVAAVAAGWLGSAGCTDQKRESSTERARSGEDRNVSDAPAGSRDAGDRAGAQTSDATSKPSGEANAPVNQTAKTISGRIVRATDDELVLREEGQTQDMTLKVDDNTTVMMNGREAAVSALPEGTHVLASFDESQKATRIEAQGPPSSTSSQSGPPGAPGSSGTDTPATSPSGSGTSSTGTPGTTGPSSTSETSQQR